MNPTGTAASRGATVDAVLGELAVAELLEEEEEGADVAPSDQPRTQPLPPAKGRPSSIPAVLETLPAIVVEPEDRGDVATYPPPAQQPTEAAAPAGPSLPRLSGLLSDVGYVFTAVTGVASMWRELGHVRERLAAERDVRTAKLVTMARAVVDDSTLSLPVLSHARAQLTAIEEQRSRDAAEVAAASQEQSELERAREAEAEAHAGELARLQAEVEESTGSLAPRNRRAAELRKQSEALQATLQGLDQRLRRLSRGLDRAGEAARGGLEAQLASVRAEREQVARDQPPLTAEQGELEPEIARLNQTLSEARRAIEAARRRERDSRARAGALHAELAARQRAGERAIQAVEQQRHAVLRELAEALYREPPEPLVTRLRVVDVHETNIARMERREGELQELIRGISKWSLARGITVLLVAIAGPAVALWLLL